MKVAQKQPDKRRERGEASRQHILQAAVSSIAALGLGSTTLDRVAERAGISRGLVVFHFKSKIKLMEEVLNYLGNRYSTGWDEVVQEQSSSSLNKILKLVAYDIRFGCDNPEYVSAWHAFWGESKGNMLYQEIVVPRERRYEREMQQVLADIIEEGNYDSQDLPAITTGLDAMMFGIWVELHLNPGPNDYEKNMTAVRFYLSKIFPDHALPEG